MEISRKIYETFHTICFYLRFYHPREITWRWKAQAHTLAAHRQRGDKELGGKWWSSNQARLVSEKLVLPFDNEHIEIVSVQTRPGKGWDDHTIKFRNKLTGETCKLLIAE